MLSYLSQLVLSYPSTMFAAWTVSLLLSAFGFPSGRHSGQIYFAGYQALLCLFVGPVVGRVIGNLLPGAITAGRWLWVLGVPVLVLALNHGAPHGPILTLPEEFFSTGGNEGAGVFLVTLPACSAIGYSLGMALAPGPRLFSRHAYVLVIAAVLFFGSAFLMRKFERSTMQNWSRIREVVDPIGLRFSRDAESLCTGPCSAAFPVVKGTVEIRERRVCSGGSLVSPGAALSHGTFAADRVKLLSGPYAGSEGWVQDYGLSEKPVVE